MFQLYAGKDFFLTEGRKGGKFILPRAAIPVEYDSKEMIEIKQYMSRFVLYHFFRKVSKVQRKCCTPKKLVFHLCAHCELFENRRAAQKNKMQANKTKQAKQDFSLLFSSKTASDLNWENFTLLVLSDYF